MAVSNTTLEDARTQTCPENWLVGGGEMGKVVRSRDWSKTPLGPIESWPQSLRTTVSLGLASNFPISLVWGPRHVQIYNDGYWPICGGKHPLSMGQDFSECWASAWPVIGEAFERALAGETSYLENQRMFLDRHGYLEETFFTFSFSPIRDETGGVGGLFHPVTETTTKMTPSHPGRADLLEIKKAGERASGLTRQLLAFSRRQILQPKVLDVNAVISGMEPMLRRLLVEHVDLMVSLVPQLGPVKMDPTQLEQILVNLAVNAADAMPRGGKLTIETAKVTLDEHYQQRHLPITPGDYVMIAVSDTGTGMDEASSRRIFEPFFTTKEVGKGTGLGLATVYGIVKQSGGDILVYSEVGRGSTFKIYLPQVTADVPGASEPSSAAGDVSRGWETVLLVEDDEAVRMLARVTLERSGYRVLEAGNPKEAVRTAREFAEPIHLLLSDVIMPESEGPPLFERLVKEHPAVRVLYMSGYADEAIVRHGVLIEGTPFLQKPFTAQALQRVIRDVLDAPAPTKALIGHVGSD